VDREGNRLSKKPTEEEIRDLFLDRGSAEKERHWRPGRSTASRMNRQVPWYQKMSDCIRRTTRDERRTTKKVRARALGGGCPA